MIWYIVNVLTIPQARDIGGKLAGNILNVLGMCRVGKCLVLCPFPHNVLMMYQPSTLVLAPSECSIPHSRQLSELANRRRLLKKTSEPSKPISDRPARSTRLPITITFQIRTSRLGTSSRPGPGNLRSKKISLSSNPSRAQSPLPRSSLSTRISDDPLLPFLFSPPSSLATFLTHLNR